MSGQDHDRAHRPSGPAARWPGQISGRRLGFRRRLGLRRKLGRIGADRRGATVIEFAFLAPIFLVLMTSIFDVSIMFLNDMQLQAAAASAAREVRIGAVSEEENTLADPFVQVRFFRDALCDQMLLTPCNKIAFQAVRLGDGFGGTLATPPPFDWSRFGGDGTWTCFNADGSVNAVVNCFTPPPPPGATGNPCQNPDGSINATTPECSLFGDGNDVILIRVARQYRFLIPYTAGLWAGWGGSANSLNLMTTAVVRNEPF